MNTRNLFQEIGLLATIGLAVASCSQDDLTGNRGLNGNAVKFGVITSSSTDDSPETRALNADDTPVVLLALAGQDTLYLHPWVTVNHSAPSAQDGKGMTRGMPVTGENFHSVCKSFHITAYADGGKLFMEDQTISKVSGNVWSPDETYFWPAEGEVDFYAYAQYNNTPTINSVNKEITFDYTVPDQATDQPDIMFAHTTGSKKTGSPVELDFNHALAAVKFVAKDVTNCTVKSITLKNLYGAGSCTYDVGEETFTWTTTEDKRNFSYDFNVTLKEQETGKQEITDVNPATTFMLIPQKLEDVTVEVVVTTSEGDFTLTGKLNNEWKAGYIYTYSISTESINWEYEFKVTPSITLELGETQDQYTVTSYRYRRGNPDEKEPVAWKAENISISETDLDGGEEVSVELKDIVDKFTYSDNNPDQKSNDYNIVLTKTKLHTNYEGDKKLQEADLKGAPENPYDLSTENGTINRTTANCYVVNAAGTYKLPLVYGNAIKNGSQNEKAYNGTGFTDYNDNQISTPYITGAKDATLVWSDGFYMFKDIKLSEDGQYLVFTIDKDYMQQANAVLAVRDASGKIMWSWHIWVTEHEVLDDTYTVHGYGNDKTQYYLMQCNLGWVDGKMVYYNQRDLTFEFTQVGSGKTATMPVLQKGEIFDYKDVGSTYYQWGRKDPLVALRNWDEIGKDEYRLHEVGKEDYGYKTEQKRVSIGESIRHPNVYYIRSGLTNWNNSPLKTLWNNEANGGSENATSSTKTIYDPSPRGFQVPVPKAFAVFVNDCSASPTATEDIGNLNGVSNQGKLGNQYEVYTESNGGGEKITLTATGQRADLDGLPAYSEGDRKGEAGGLWAMYGVYFMTCVPITETSANTFVIRHDNMDGAQHVYTRGFSGNMTMARPVRPVKETN